MKKISLLAIASFFSALAFSQSVATPTVPGQPKPGRSTTKATTQVATPAFTNVNGVKTATTQVKIQPIAATKVGRPAATTTGKRAASKAAVIQQ